MPGPIGLNTRSETASTCPASPASWNSRVPARWLTPYALTGCAGSSSLTETPSRHRAVLAGRAEPDQPGLRHGVGDRLQQFRRDQRVRRDQLARRSR